MDVKTDLQIAREADIKSIYDIAAKAGIESGEVIPYGSYKAKISLKIAERLGGRKNGKLILVSAINPTPSGEGKTTISIGLSDAIARLDKNVFLALREPSLGPVFGMKGGAAGGGYAQVIPMEDINLHFTGDIHAVTAANNLLCAIVDNHIHQGNELRPGPAGRFHGQALHGRERQAAPHDRCAAWAAPANGMPREEGFDITAASEVMAVLCLATDLHDLKERLGKIKVGYTRLTINRCWSAT